MILLDKEVLKASGFYEGLDNAYGKVTSTDSDCEVIMKYRETDLVDIYAREIGELDGDELRSIKADLNKINDLVIQNKNSKIYELYNNSGIPKPRIWIGRQGKEFVVLLCVDYE